jgi:hypothetical protein
MGVLSGTVHFGGRIRWIVGFATGSSILVGAALLILWALTGFADLGVSGQGLVALILGIVFSTALGSALMALSFYGDHNSQREDVERPESNRCRDAE